MNNKNYMYYIAIFFFHNYNISTIPTTVMPKAFSYVNILVDV